MDEELVCFLCLGFGQRLDKVFQLRSRRFNPVGEVDEERVETQQAGRLGEMRSVVLLALQEGNWGWSRGFRLATLRCGQ